MEAYLGYVASSPILRVVLTSNSLLQRWKKCVKQVKTSSYRHQRRPPSLCHTLHNIDHCIDIDMLALLDRRIDYSNVTYCMLDRSPRHVGTNVAHSAASLATSFLCLYTSNDRLWWRLSRSGSPTAPLDDESLIRNVWALVSRGCPDILCIDFCALCHHSPAVGPASLDKGCQSTEKNAGMRLLWSDCGYIARGCPWIKSATRLARYHTFVQPTLHRDVESSCSGGFC